ncbi:hypothetical protein HDU76_009166, partial [Blyttiomyces sp. JEL0837]
MAKLLRPTRASLLIWIIAIIIIYLYSVAYYQRLTSNENASSDATVHQSMLQWLISGNTQKVKHLEQINQDLSRQITVLAREKAGLEQLAASVSSQLSQAMPNGTGSGWEEEIAPMHAGNLGRVQAGQNEQQIEKFEDSNSLAGKELASRNNFDRNRVKDELCERIAVGVLIVGNQIRDNGL